MQAIVSCNNFSYAYPSASRLALLDLNFEILPGSFNVICGPSGAGKSTLCKALAGIVPNYYGGGYKGSIEILNTNTLNRNIADLALDVGIVLDDYESQLVSLTVEEELSFALLNRQLPAAQIATTIPEVLAAVGLAGRENYQLDELSGGQRQRLVIASVIATKPKILVLDEPVSALDPEGAVALYQVINSLRAKYNITVIVVEHNLNYVLPYMENLLIMQDAQLVHCGDLNSSLQFMFNTPSLNLLLPELSKVQLLLNQQAPLNFSQWRTATQAIQELTNCLATPTIQGDYLAPSYQAAQTPPLLDLQAVNFAYRTGEPILKDINLTVHQGEFIALLGQNGSGKTTLSRLLMALNKARSGKITFQNQDTANFEPADLADKIGYVFQNPDLQILADTVFEEVAYGARLKGYSETELTELVNQALIATGLKHLAQAYPRTLSFGQKRRLGIAAALVLKPQILILDEITSGQDNLEKALIMNYLAKLNRAENLTIILITHDMPTVLQYASRVLTLKQGEVVFDGGVAELFSGAQPLGEWGLRLPSIVQLGNHFKLPNNSANNFAPAFVNLLTGGELDAK